MALVAYSDSEGSDTEDTPQPNPASIKPAGTKAQPGKIKVELPSFRAEPGQGDGALQPPAKRAKTSGAFGGFNDLLPAPKRAVTQASGLKQGVSLKTSSEVAFSRTAPPESDQEGAQMYNDGEYDDFGNRRAGAAGSGATVEMADAGSSEVKIVGKATRFRPLSVASNNNKKKKKAVKRNPAISDETQSPEMTKLEGTAKVGDVVPAAPIVKPKRSLFSMQQDEVEPNEAVAPIPLTEIHVSQPPIQHPKAELAGHSPKATPNTLHAVASDLNLSAAERRQLFGRKGGKEANITHFNLDSEYRANERLRQAGETIDHKAVKAIAPGKHSLQQLVNNARSNQEGIEDKWAEGRRARGEGGSKYGWGK